MGLLIYLFFLAIAISACYNKNDIVKLPNSNSEYTILKKGTGIQPRVGDNIQYSMIAFGNDTIQLADMRDTLAWATVPIQSIRKNTRALDEMLYSLSVGDSVVMHLPSADVLEGMENIHTISYYIKLERIIDQATMEKHMTDVRVTQVDKLTKDLLAEYNAGRLDDKLVKVRGAMTYYLVERGKGPKVMQNDQVAVSFHGIIADTGEEFESSYRRNKEFKFNVGKNEVIRAWEDIMHFLYEGDKAILFVPWQLGYGAEGRPPIIPEKADLVFYMEVLSRRPVK
jgi:FKBP-type peptidyl-prolyl cis-trans isomerase